MRTMKEPTDHRKPATADDIDPDVTPLDRHGHDPDEYDWVPVLRKRRKDGWTPERQRAFIGALADTGVVSEAARSVGMSRQAAYRLRARAPQFAFLWDEAVKVALQQCFLVDGQPSNPPL